MKIPTIAAKLEIPLLPASYLPRSRLDRAFGSWTGKTLVLVTAGAGFGKTSFLAANLRSAPVSGLWYALDESDRDTVVFGAHLRDMLPAGTDEGTSGSPELLDRTLAHLIRHFTDSGTETFLVFDDVHVIADAPPVLHFLERLIRYLPRHITPIFASREPVAMRTMKTLAGGTTAALTASDLAFTEDEVASLFRQRFADAALPARLCRRIVTETEGWAAGIEILFQALRAPTPRSMEQALEQLAGSGSGWFAYFAEEVVARLDEKTGDFLRRSSILPHLDPALCNRVLGLRNSRSVLVDLQRRNLFTFPVTEDGTAYRYHHLFRDFLREQLRRTVKPSEVRDLQQRAARALARRGSRAEAAAAHVEGGDPEAALQQIEKAGEDLLATGQYQVLQRTLSKIPARLLRKHPTAMYLIGRVSEVLGEWEEAEKIYQRSLRAGATGARRAELMGLVAHLKMRRGEYSRGLALGRSALAESDLKDSRIRGHILCICGLCECALGRLAEGEAHLRQAAAIFRRRKDGLDEARVLYLLAANVYFQRGQFHAARDAARRAVVIFKKAGERRRMSVSLGVLGFVTAAGGDDRDARDLTEEALRIAEALDYPAIKGYCHECLGRCALLGRDLTRSAEHFQTSLEYGERLGDVALLVYPLIGLAETKLLAGRRPAARRHARRAIDIAREKRDAFQEAICRRLLGTIEGDRENWRRAERSLRRMGAAFELHRLLLIRLDADDLPARRADDLLRELLIGAEDLEHDHLFLNVEPERAARVLPRAVRAGIESPFASRLLVQLGDHAVPHLASLIPDLDDEVRARFVEILIQIGGREAHRVLATLADPGTVAGRNALAAVRELERIPGTPLRIRALGPLEIAAGHRELAHGRWRSARALRLFQLLLIHRFRWVPRDVVVDTLWPETDPDKAANSLWQTIHVLRRALEPNLARPRASSYIRLNNELCRLEPGEGYVYDVEEFEASLREAKQLLKAGRGKAAEPLLRTAEELYHGDFLEESPYEDFVTLERERLRDELLRGTETLLEILSGGKRWPEVVPLCRRAIARDPFHESFHWHLVRAQLGLRNRREALDDYHRYEKMMQREMDLLPSARMKALADRATAIS